MNTDTTMTPAQKAVETRQKNRDARAKQTEEELAAYERQKVMAGFETRMQLAALEKIRDNPDSRAVDVIRAVRLIDKIRRNR